MKMILKNQQGLTLIELMIAIAIIGVLAAVAYPLYTEQVKKTRRSDAKTSLAELAQLQEERFVENRSYATTLDALLGGEDRLGFEKKGEFYLSKDKHYLLSNHDSENQNGSSFILKATAREAQASDTHCAEFKLYSTGKKEATNADCW